MYSEILVANSIILIIYQEQYIFLSCTQGCCLIKTVVEVHLKLSLLCYWSTPYTQHTDYTHYF